MSAGYGMNKPNNPKRSASRCSSPGEIDELHHEPRINGFVHRRRSQHHHQHNDNALQNGLE
jgi:hypothetical protein